MKSPCPNCKKGSKCGCVSCIERNGFDEETAIHNAETAQCPFCKKEYHYDAWLDAEWDMIHSRNAIPTPNVLNDKPLAQTP